MINIHLLLKQHLVILTATSVRSLTIVRAVSVKWMWDSRMLRIKAAKTLHLMLTLILRPHHVIIC